MEEITILDAAAMNRALTRITYEIMERYKSIDDLVIIGIRTRGIYLAKRIAQKIYTIENQTIPVGELDITLYRDDRHDIGEVNEPTINQTDIPHSLKGKKIVLVDDVLFTGRTVRAALNAIMEFGRPQNISLAVLVDRGHRELPIRPDYIGKNVPTSLKEQIRVKVSEIDQEDSITLVK